MQQPSGYGPDDFTQPAFCRSCGVHVPKAYLAMSGGVCPNCLRITQQPMPTMQPAMPYPGMYPAPRRSFFRSTGCAAWVLGLCALGLFGWGIFHFLKLGSVVSGTHHVAGVSEQVAQHSDTMAEVPVDESSSSEIKTMAAKTINATFGDGAANAWTIDTTSVRDKRTDVTTYYAGGNFPCVIGKDRETVTWKIGYRKEENGEWTLVSQEASYPSYDGVAQYDWAVGKFIHLVP